MIKVDIRPPIFHPLIALCKFPASTFHQVSNYNGRWPVGNAQLSCNNSYFCKHNQLKPIQWNSLLHFSFSINKYRCFDKHALTCTPLYFRETRGKNTEWRKGCNTKPKRKNKQKIMKTYACKIHKSNSKPAFPWHAMYKNTSPIPFTLFCRRKVTLTSV